MCCTFSTIKSNTTSSKTWLRVPQMLHNPSHALNILCELCYPEFVQYLRKKVYAAFVHTRLNACTKTTRLLHVHSWRARWPYSGTIPSGNVYRFYFVCTFVTHGLTLRMQRRQLFAAIPPSSRFAAARSACISCLGHPGVLQ